MLLKILQRWQFKYFQIFVASLEIQYVKEYITLQRLSQECN